MSKVAQPDRASLGRWMGKVALEHVDRCEKNAALGMEAV